MNKNVDALSRSPHEPAPLAVAEDDGEVQISLISESSEQTIELSRGDSRRPSYLGGGAEERDRI